jgi:hypothetical protein
MARYTFRASRPSCKLTSEKPHKFSKASGLCQGNRIDKIEVPLMFPRQHTKALLIQEGNITDGMRLVDPVLQDFFAQNHTFPV